MSLRNRLFAPIVFWGNLVWTKIRARVWPKTRVIPVPREALPLLKVGTIAMMFCQYAGKQPEDLILSEKLNDVVQNQADTDTQLFVQKVLFGQDTFKTTFDWLVFLGDAREDQRKDFETFVELETLVRLEYKTSP